MTRFLSTGPSLSPAVPGRHSSSMRGGPLPSDAIAGYSSGSEGPSWDPSPRVGLFSTCHRHPGSDHFHPGPAPLASPRRTTPVLLPSWPLELSQMHTACLRSGFSVQAAHSPNLVVASSPPAPCFHAFQPLLHPLATCPQGQTVSLLVHHPCPRHTGTRQALTCFLSGSFLGPSFWLGSGLSTTPKYTLGNNALAYLC